MKLHTRPHDANVLGLKPLNILHLWLFEDSGQARLSLHLKSSWGEIGTLHLLLCAEAAAGRLYRYAQRSGTLEAACESLRRRVLHPALGEGAFPAPADFPGAQ